MLGRYEELGRLSYPPLVNLSKFRTDRLNVGGDTAEFYTTVSTIDYAEQMPGLEHVEFQAPAMLELMEFVRNGEAVEDQNRCTSARKLTLTIASAEAEADLAFFKIMFPNI